MHDITKFLSKSEIKQELANVYVQDGYAIATDGFRLAKIKLDDFCTDNVSNGYYNSKTWKAIAKAYGKKYPDLVTVIELVKENATHSDAWKNFLYPGYDAIIPKENTLKSIDGRYNITFLIDFLELAGTKLQNSELNYIDISDIKTDGRMMLYSKNDVTLLLMQLNKNK